MHPEDDYFAPPPRSPIPAAIVASLFTTIAVFFGLRVLEAKGLLPESLSRLGNGPKIEGATAPLAAEVPSLVGLTPEQARLALQANGLSLSVTGERDNPQVAPGAIVEQAPLAQARAVKGTVVQVTVSTAPKKIALAKLSGLKVDEAIRQLAAQKLTAGPQKLLPQNVLPPGIVIDTEPPAGTLVPPESRVTLLVSAPATPPPPGATPVGAPPPAPSPVGAPPTPVAAQGPAPVSAAPEASAKTLPRVTGLRLGAARELLERQGFKVGKLRRISDADRASNVVIDQSPPAATKSSAGRSVDLTINN